ncbi:MAG: DNA-directed RNA polymerase subunit alpha [Nitrospirae bacterium CG18_big_fil_WC_8_21_14_2_50_70_55]|nr:DNA-directed RNA polymerase subunit alpha [Deltaproteobacteria bacterium]OIP67022.1 MAG: DNA-directed RNA polymerase subunit alpha [Nitrospirae bacterium CG2_30_70_394]PIQ07290.1 MAG: DNA-directed RNA polymerase subunit alpha [Nitrospirae bacterium CG18_big_fil_WC_8_21_14_2_50_70_55]PIU80155.1 MAG: DNA-directed RNA polymerase subunit alpha [Nitrospirae bacterium CG06_land_8_20_14_3_00_70_43]PIW82670.1 MAG: DNA-directed RNA polymerase subunit alpha [Nitrospirae bacterium CG_4_8_14_3_um_filter
MKQVLRGFHIPRRLEAIGEVTATQGTFVAQPFERGFGTTIGNSLRRILLSSISGAAVTGVRIQGVLHEFTYVPGVLEDVTELILNFKGVRFRFAPGFDERLIYLKATKAGVVTAADIDVAGSGLEIVNPEHHIATLEKGSVLDVELKVTLGRGYVTAAENQDPDDSVDMIPIDCSFSPVMRVNAVVDNARVGQDTDYDKLTLEVVTDGAVNPQDAVIYAAHILREHMAVFTSFGDEDVVVASVSEGEEESLRRKLLRSVEELELSVRAYNCLKKAEIRTIFDLCQKSESEMLKTKNFGRRSLNEIKELLESIGLSLGMQLEPKLVAELSALITVDEQPA